jgi:hypothetical protein
MVQIRGDVDMDIAHQYQKSDSRHNNHAKSLQVPEASSYMWEEMNQVFASRLNYTLQSIPRREDLVERLYEAKSPDYVDTMVT